MRNEKEGTAATKAKNRYNRKKYKQLAIRVKKEEFELLEAEKIKRKCSWNDLIMSFMKTKKTKTKKEDNESKDLGNIYYDLFCENEKNKSRAHIAVSVAIIEFILLVILLAVH